MVDRRRPWVWPAARAGIGLLLMLIWLAAPAAADPNHGGEPVEETPSPMPQPPPTPAPVREPSTPRLELRVPAETGLGDEVRLEATLLTERGRPLAGERITFFAEAAWSDDLRGNMVLGSAYTDETGTAVTVTDLRTSGETQLGARFSGNDRFTPVTATGAITVTGDEQLYTPETALKLPPGAWWLLALVAAVWGTYLLVARQVLGVARAGVRGSGAEERGVRHLDRRRFLSAFALPAGLMAAVGSLGSGLLTVIARSPRTHGNREPYGWHAGPLRHRLTPVAHVGAHPDMRPVPDVLEREVSFSEEIMPILLEKGGPHSHPSTSSPPPHGVRFDSYAAIMGSEPDAHADGEPHDDEGEGTEPDAHTDGEVAHGHRLVVPGKPEESILVMMLLDPAHQMPPSVPLTEDEIQLIASWVAQGARDN